MDHKITIRLECDNDTENPFDNDGAWRIVFFSNKYRDSQDPDSEEFHTIGFRKKLEAGTAFILDCYEHSGTSWSLSGQGQQCAWDTSRSAGLLIMDDVSAIGKPDKASGQTVYQYRRKSAELMLDVYNAWANGSCLYFSAEVTEVDGEETEIHLDSCGGFIIAGKDDETYVLNDYIVPSIVSYLETSGDDEPELDIEVKGPMDYLFDADDITEAVNKKLSENYHSRQTQGELVPV